MPQKDFLTWHEAVKIFIDAGQSETTLRRRVDAGIIQAVLPEGRKRGKRYPKNQVLAAVKRKKEASDAVNSGRGATDWVQESDLPYLLALDFQMYGIENTVDISITSTWWKKNPHACRILFNKEDRKDIWGAISVMPMQEETIFRILRDEIQEKQITADDILTYEANDKYAAYIPSAVIRPEHQRYFRTLVESILQFWCDQYPRIQIAPLYAFAVSDQGWDLMRHLFFSPRYDLGQHAFELDPYRRNPSRLIKNFQQCLKEKGWKAKNTD
jgi:hypothetical protein